MTILLLLCLATVLGAGQKVMQPDVTGLWFLEKTESMSGPDKILKVEKDGHGLTVVMIVAQLYYSRVEHRSCSIEHQGKSPTGRGIVGDVPSLSSTHLTVRCSRGESFPIVVEQWSLSPDGERLTIETQSNNAGSSHQTLSVTFTRSNKLPDNCLIVDPSTILVR